jgi:outer membrane receptor protein involved in Fe transport
MNRQVLSGHAASKFNLVQLKRGVLSSASAAVLLAVAGAAHAQAPAATAVEEVVVTATRLQATGFDAPTPTTVFGAEEIAQQAQPNIFTAVAQLPSLQGSSGTTSGNGGTSGGGNGLSSFNMRGLGASRTLTLLDGQRVVPAFVQGIADISAFPQLLVRRVDVVTGGASASYGSDAVAGVINFVTDTRFEGFKYNLQAGITSYGDGGLGNFQAAYGTSFAGGRGHLQTSVEWMNENGIGPGNFGVGEGPNGRNFYKAPFLQVKGVSATPAGQPQIIRGTNGQSYQYAKDGLITSGPLQGTAFGPNGSTYAFQYGSNGVPSRAANGAVSNCVAGWCIGGDNSASPGNGTSLSSDLDRKVWYSRLSYELTDNLELFTTINLANVKTNNVPNPGARYDGNLTIRCDNAFLPASVVAACAANNITQFAFGTYNGNYPDNIVVAPERNQTRIVVGADGSFDLGGKEWTYNTYFQYGRADTYIEIDNITLRPRFAAAIDAINVGGQIVCRNVAARAAGCLPWNPFGPVQNTKAAWRYIAPENGPYQDSKFEQDAFSISAAGSPIDLWAGPLALAFGYEWRRESYSVKGDPYGGGSAGTPFSADYPADPILNATSNWYAGNFFNGEGEFTVQEAFAEAGVTLWDSEGFGKADMQIAGRATDYSTSGRVNTWKVGASWETPLEGLRLRTVRSRDIRAPNLGELFAAPIVTNSSVVPPGGTAVTILNRAEGNPDLLPERSITQEFGVVYSPTWLSGFRASVDFYSIEVTDAISSINAQQTVNLCFENPGSSICNSVFLTGTPPANPNYVIVSQRNLSTIKTSGYDIEASYRFNLDRFNVPGDFTVRALATHVNEFLTDSGIRGAFIRDSAGENSGDRPTWKGLAVQSWDIDKLGFTLTERWFSDGVVNSSYIECQTNCPVPTAEHPTINDNSLPGEIYFDFGVTYDMSESTTLYFKVNNIADIQPAPIPAQNVNNIGTNPALYDTLGRTFRIGVRGTF